MEIVFNDSAAGSMKMAQKYDAQAMRKSMLGYIGASEPTEAEIIQHVAGQAMGGSPKDVLAIGFQLDIGNLEGNVDNIHRRNLYQKMNPFAKTEEINRIFQQLQKNEEVLLESAKQGKTIRVWRSDAPFSACGFAYVCHLLKDIDCSLSVVDSPDFLEIETLPAGQLYRLTEFTREVTPLEKTVHSQIWQTLQTENSPLRAVVNGKVLSVPEDFYDCFINKAIPNGEFLLRELISNVLSYGLGVSDAWISFRVEKMIEVGKFLVMNEQNLPHPYEKKLKHRQEEQQQL